MWDVAPFSSRAHRNARLKAYERLRYLLPYIASLQIEKYYDGRSEPVAMLTDVDVVIIDLLIKVRCVGACMLPDAVCVSS